MNNRFLKSSLIILLILVETISIFLMFKSNKNIRYEEYSLDTKKDNIALLREKDGEDGTYEYVSGKFNPSEDYNYNSTKSMCIDQNGNKITGANALEFNKTKNTVKVKVKSTAYCYLYFDIIKVNIGDNFDFNYNGQIQTFTAPVRGWYKLEVWGAQGGSSSYNSNSASGGYGGYSVGEVQLNANQTIYIVVGGKGNSIAYSSSITPDDSTGYNGGGYAGYSSGNSSHGGGGGATHIATSTGLLSTLSSNQSSVLIVAGGGGGASTHLSYPSYSGIGGSGGGEKGGSAVTANTTCYNYGTGGTQSSGGSYTACASNGTTSRVNNPPANPGFGSGSNYTSLSTSGLYAGGGGGWYGGQSGYHAPGGGGSGYIGNTNLKNKYMICYNCYNDNMSSSNTYSRSCHSTTATSNCAKDNNGFARITYVGTSQSSSIATVTKGYQNSDQTYTVPEKGVYRLEVWGAQGGSTDTKNGGYGSYSVGEIELSKNTVLHIYTGGQATNAYGGFNGGGNGNGTTSDALTGDTRTRGGGGATHIATVTGELSTLSSETNMAKVLIVAGGGGGVSEKNGGGNAGGIQGNKGIGSRDDGTAYGGDGGTQTAGGAGGYFGSSSGKGSFGKGGKANPITSNDTGEAKNWAGGGGSGWYGGGGGDWSSNNVGGRANAPGGGGGGSGYIGNSNLFNKHMSCYNCTADSNASTYTISNTNVSETATKDYSKQGNGYVRITFLYKT